MVYLLRPTWLSTSALGHPVSAMANPTSTLCLARYQEPIRGCNAILGTIAGRPDASIILGLQCAGNFRAQGPDEI